MLRYLDQDGSYAGRINENYAREIMELHTLGVDNGYTQADVTELAHLLTGWMSCEQTPPGAGGYSREFGFRFDPSLSDGRPRELLGMRLGQAGPEQRFERVCTAIEALAAHPGTAEFIARRLAEHYVCLPAPDGLVRDLARVFIETGGDLREVLVAAALHDEFWAQREKRRLAHPLDYAIRLSRVSGFDNSWYLGDFLQRSGAGLFDRATPDGYPEEDSAYTDSNAMVQRWALADQAVWNLATLVPDSLRWGNAPNSPTWAQDVVDSIAIGLTGRLLGEESNRIAVEFFESQSSNPGERALAAATLVAQLPEANLR